MRVQLPKLSHGWRRYVGEVGIIVIGVLIALGADQLVDNVRQNGNAEEARRAIRSELETNMSRLASRVAIRSCWERRIAEIQPLLDTASAGGAFTAPRWIGRPQYWTMLTARWDAFTQAGYTALLPPEELADYAQMYAWMRNITAEMVMEQAAWARLRAMEHLSRVTPQMAFELGNSLSDARFRGWRIGQHTQQLANPERKLRLRKVRNTLPAPTGICVAMTTPRDQAIREAGSIYGEP